MEHTAVTANDVRLLNQALSWPAAPPRNQAIANCTMVLVRGHREDYAEAAGERGFAALTPTAAALATPRGCGPSLGACRTGRSRDSVAEPQRLPSVADVHGYCGMLALEWLDALSA